MNNEYLMNLINQALSECSQERESFMLKFQQNAHHTLSWGDSIFKVVSKEKFYNEIKNMLKENNQMSIQDIINFTTEELINHATFMEISNLSNNDAKLELEYIKVKADFIKKISR